MGALVAIVTWAVTNGPQLIKLGMDIAPVVGVAKDAVLALVEGNHVDEDTAKDLHAKVSVLEGLWAAEVERAKAELAGQTSGT